MNDQIAIIIARKLQGNATPEELQELQIWMNEDFSNKDDYALLEKIWEAGDLTLQLPSFNTNAAWQKTNSLITAGESTGKPQQKIFSLFYGKWVAAAAALIIAIIGTWYFAFHSGNQTITATAANKPVVLPDGSNVILRKGSSIEYPATFDTKERVVRLTGEAFFKVQHNSQQPFRIVAGHSQITVLGTTFLVRSKETTDEVVVATGKVRVEDKNQLENKIVLEAGQKVVLQDNHFLEATVTGSNYLAWNTGLLEFKHSPLTSVLDDVAHFYDTPIELTPALQSAAGNIFVTLRFENQSLEQVLEEISLTTGLTSKKEPGKIVFSQK